MCVFLNFSWENHATQLQEPQLVDGLFVELLVCKVTRENTMAGNVWPLYFPTSSSTWDPLIWETHWLCIWPSFGQLVMLVLKKDLGKYDGRTCLAIVFSRNSFHVKPTYMRSPNILFAHLQTKNGQNILLYIYIHTWVERGMSAYIYICELSLLCFTSMPFIKL